MPSASPITEFVTNAFMEPEMLSFELPSSVSKRFSPSGRSAFSTLLGPPTTTATNNNNNNNNNTIYTDNNSCSPIKSDMLGLLDNPNDRNLTRFGNGIEMERDDINFNHVQDFGGFSPNCLTSDQQFSITSSKPSIISHFTPGTDINVGDARSDAFRHDIDTKTFVSITSNTRTNTCITDEVFVNKNSTKSCPSSFANKDRFHHSDSEGFAPEALEKRNEFISPSICKTPDTNDIGMCRGNCSMGNLVENSSTITTASSQLVHPTSFDVDHAKVYTNMDDIGGQFVRGGYKIPAINNIDERFHDIRSSHIPHQHNLLTTSTHLKHHRSTPPPPPTSSFFTNSSSSSTSSPVPHLYNPLPSSSSSSTTISPPPPPPSSSPACMFVPHSHTDFHRPHSLSSHGHLSLNRSNINSPACKLNMAASVSLPNTSGKNATAGSTHHNTSMHASPYDNRSGNSPSTTLYSSSSPHSRYTLNRAQPPSQDVTMSETRDDYPLCDGDDDDDEGCPSRISKKRFPCEPEDHFLQDDSDDGAMSWTLKSPKYWSSSEVLDWLFYIGQEQGLDMQQLRAENFQAVTGERLCHMEREDFTRLEPTFGVVIHEMLQKLMSGETYVKLEPSPGCYGYSSTPSPTYSTHSDSPGFETADHSRTFHDTTPLFDDIKQEETPCIYQGEVPTPGQFFKQEHFTQYGFDMNDSPTSCLNAPQGLVYPGDCYLYQSTAYSHGAPPGSHPTHPSSIRSPCCFTVPPPPPSGLPPPPTLPRRKPGRPRVKNVIQAAKHNKDKKAKNQHLWEFIYEILMNPMYNPQYLKWENQREGVFRFVQSEAVAQLWGGRKNNENMTYEKLSRAMRHYYRRGILERVEGRRLVYKFSLKAIDRMKAKKSNASGGTSNNNNKNT